VVEPAFWGVPLITPVEVLIDRLRGKSGEDQIYPPPLVYRGVPPLAVAVTGPYGTLIWPFGSELVVIVSTFPMASTNCFATDWWVGLVASVTVAVTVLVLVVEGVPEISPVVALMLKPVGNPVCVHVYGGVPPEATIVLL